MQRAPNKGAMNGKPVSCGSPRVHPMPMGVHRSDKRQAIIVRAVRPTKSSGITRTLDDCLRGSCNAGTGSVCLGTTRAHTSTSTRPHPVSDGEWWLRGSSRLVPTSNPSPLRPPPPPLTRLLALSLLSPPAFECPLSPPSSHTLTHPPTHLCSSLPLRVSRNPGRLTQWWWWEGRDNARHIHNRGHE